MSLRLRSILSGTCFALGAIWAVAGVMKMIFGMAISFPLLPPLALEQIDVAKSLIVALVWFIAGALLGRYAPVRGAVREAVSARSNEEL
jgi:hypothetical protein